MKLYAVHIFQHTVGEWEDSLELWSTSYVNARSEKDAISKVHVPKDYDYGSSRIHYIVGASETHII